MYLTFLFLIGCQFLVATAEIINCHVWASDNANLPPSEYGESIRIDHCDTTREKCCRKGCCAKDDSKTIWFVVIFLGIGTIGACYGCYRRCCDNEESGITGRNYRDNEDSPSTRLGSTQTPQIFIVPQQPEPSAPTGEGSVPLTPPPSYEVALTMPSAPAESQDSPLLGPDGRIPSYEDVMAGKKK